MQKEPVSTEDTQSIKKFCDLMDRISQLPFINTTRSYKFQIKFDHGNLYQKIEGIDEDAFRSFLLDFRKTVAQGSSTNWNYICNKVEKSHLDEIKKEEVRKCRAALKEFGQHGCIRYVFGETEQKPEEMIDVWLNGHYFHEDEQKSKYINKGSLGFATYKFVFMENVLNQTRVLFILNRLLKSFFE